MSTRGSIQRMQGDDSVAILYQHDGAAPEDMVAALRAPISGHVEEGKPTR